MQDGSVVQGPAPTHQGSRDALLRLPIQQPGEAHLNPEMVSPTSPVAPKDALGINSGAPASRTTPKRVGGDSGRYNSYPVDEREDDREYRHRSRRYDPYRSSGYRGPYVEEYSDEEERPRAYRRPARRYSRPPPAHQNFPRDPRYSRDMPRGSTDRESIEYEPDTPTKPRFHYYYGSEDEEARRNGYYPYADGGNGRDPPRRTPSKEEVLRLPWTMWMNSNAKNRTSRPSPKSHPHSSSICISLLAAPDLAAGHNIPLPDILKVQPRILMLH